jgi:tripartite-type tricarboxylate transporter receptor subunit TctC
MNISLSRRRTVTALALLAGLGNAAAQGFPSRSIRIIVPFPPGGSADVLARTIADQLGKSMGQPVVVENKPGVGGIVGAETVASAPADGYTLLFANTNIAINPSLYKKLPYDTARAFAPVVLMVEVPNLLLVSAQVKANNVQELVALAKRQPGALNYASAGSGTFPHLAIEMFKMLSGAPLTHIPYKGAAPALNALLAGEVQVLSNDLVTATQYVKAGKIRALAITGATRSPLLPDVPTMAEAGVRGYEAVGWQGIMAPAGTPAAVIARLNTEINKALADPELRQSLSNQGLTVIGGSAQQFADFLRQDTARWASTVKASGASAD